MNAWLRCRVDSGMFSDELAVTYPPISTNTGQTSVFVPRCYVRSDQESQGEVLVDVVESDGAYYAVLPSEQSDIVWPDAADLKQP